MHCGSIINLYADYEVYGLTEIVSSFETKPLTRWKSFKNKNVNSNGSPLLSTIIHSYNLLEPLLLLTSITPSLCLLLLTKTLNQGCCSLRLRKKKASWYGTYALFHESLRSIMVILKSYDARNKKHAHLLILREALLRLKELDVISIFFFDNWIN